MKGNEIIILKNISKSFKIYQDKSQTLRDRVITRGRRKHAYFQVLKDISFTINRGEVVGLIGENGCGKSTALKLINRIMYPDQGTVEVRGRVSSLLELGAGFHPELSGRENIYTNAAIFGLSKKETDLRLSTIIDFSELWDFIDNPVRTYSSGMYMRLAFSVAINVDADILLIDEILAVGDKNFQEKCYNRLKELKKQGITIIIVTHDTSTVEDFCSRAIWLHEGNIAADGFTDQAVNTYLEYMFEKQLLMDKRQQEEQRKAELARKDYTRDDISELYNKYLNRLPESDEVIDFYFGMFDRKRDIELSIKNSAEHRSIVLRQRQGDGAVQQPQSAGLSRSDIIVSYRTYLLRDPESEQVIDSCQKAHGNIEELVENLKNSPEYRLLCEKKELNKERHDQLDGKAVTGDSTIESGPKPAEITSILIQGPEAKAGENIFYGMPAEIRVGFKLNMLFDEIRCTIDIYTSDGALCYHFSTKSDKVRHTALSANGEFVCSFPVFPLLPGKYKLYAAILDKEDLLIDSRRHGADIAVVPSGGIQSNVPHEWSLT